MQKIERELYRYGSLKEQTREIEEEIREFAAKKIEIVDGMLRASVTDCVRVQGGRSNDPVYDVVEKLVDVYDTQITEASARLKEIYAEHERMRERIVRAGLDDYERRYIGRRYIDRVAHADIAVEMGYCERQLSRIRNTALKKIVSGG